MKTRKKVKKAKAPSVAQLKRQIENWQEEAKRLQTNINYYRGLVVEIGNMFGLEAKIAEDGKVSEDVLCAKVPSLVRAVVVRFVLHTPKIRI